MREELKASRRKCQNILDNLVYSFQKRNSCTQFLDNLDNLVNAWPIYECIYIYSEKRLNPKNDFVLNQAHTQYFVNGPVVTITLSRAASFLFGLASQFKNQSPLNPCLSTTFVLNPFPFKPLEGVILFTEPLICQISQGQL